MLEFGERWIEGTFFRRARAMGNDIGYDSIVGGGKHATTLHWIDNTGPITPGELVLLDMGVEARSLYTADVTRTLPVDGTFTPLQRELYDLVHAAQEAGIQAVAPGQPFLAAHDAAMEVLAHGLEGMGLLPVSAQEALDPDSKVYARWTLHGTSHMLGLDVHDCGKASDDAYRNGTLEEGYVLTVEPGLYFQEDDLLVPEELRGIGIRIEDDVLVTADGFRNLSASLPRTSDRRRGVDGPAPRLRHATARDDAQAPGRFQIPKALGRPPTYGRELGAVPGQDVDHRVLLHPLQPLAGVDLRRVVAGEEPVAVEPARRHQDEDPEGGVAEGEPRRQVLGVQPGDQVDLVDVAAVDVLELARPTSGWR